MAKATYLKVQHRKAVIDTMARKLATPGVTETKVFIAKKKTSQAIFFSVTITITILLISIILLFTVPNTFVKKRIGTPVFNRPTPVSLLKKSYNEGKLDNDMYAKYLVYILIKYDSLPSEYKTTPPFVRDDEVYSHLSKIWGSVHMNVRDQLISQLPALSQKVNSKAHAR